MEDNWVAMMLFGLLGGLGLFLLGMNMMSQGLMKSAGDKMRSILSNLTKNRFFAVGLGTFVTMIIQSSSATTVMLISFVNAGLMKFAQTLGIILGADIGTTITAQMIAFKLTDYALLMIAIGFAVKTIPKNEKVQYIGEGILGFGILFFGMHIMSESMVPLRTYEPFINLILHLESPVTGILIGALFTALIQSSSAFIGIMIVLATQGLLSIEAGVPLLLGANIGTAVTAFLASMNTSREAKKVAVAHTLFKLVGLLLVVWWIPDFIRLVKYISPVTDNAGQLTDLSKELPRQIANAHTLFNVIVTAVSLPFVNTLARFINFLLPEQAPKKRVLSTIYLRDDADMPPSLALNLAKQEVNHLASIVQEMTSRFIDPFIKKEKPDLVWMQEREEEVDFLRDNITSYVLKLASGNIKKERINEAFEMLYTVKEFEQIADLVSTTYMNKSVKWIKSDYMFSEEGRSELIEYHQQVLKQLNRAIEAFKDYNLETARLMHEKHQKYRKVAVELQRNHYNRLAAFIENSINSSKTHLELMTVLATIYSHSTNVARVILQISNGGENNES
jgi:phosphate:Na+ symporter